MLKLLGAVFIVVATTWTGFEMAKIYTERPRQIRQLRAALQSLEAEIMYGHTPLHTASQQIAKQLAQPVSALFFAFSDQLDKGSDSAKNGVGAKLKEGMGHPVFEKKRIRSAEAVWRDARDS